MTEMVEVVIDSLRVSLTNQQRIVVLREIGVERYLPIWIGPYEAESITIALQEIEVSRPQTHDLLKNILLSLGAHILRVEVNSLSDDVFYGNLVVEINNQIVNIDSRPSDALALAVRTHVPILVSRDVIDKAGIVPEHDLSDSSAAPEENFEPTEKIQDSEDRLSVFEDFLQNLEGNMDDSSSGDEDEDDEDDEGPSD